MAIAIMSASAAYTALFHKWYIKLNSLRLNFDSADRLINKSVSPSNRYLPVCRRFLMLGVAPLPFFTLPNAEKIQESLR